MNCELFELYRNISESPESLGERLMERAYAGEHTKTTWLNNYAEYIAAKKLKLVLKKLISGFKKSTQIMVNNYVEKLNQGIDDVSILVSGQSFIRCAKFYQVELADLVDKIKEFDAYLDNGNLLNMLEGNERPYRDMHDFRQKDKPAKN